MDVYKRISEQAWGCVGDLVEVVPEEELVEGDTCFILQDGVEPSEHNGWLQNEFLEFCRQEEVSTFDVEELWHQVFEILRSHFARISSVACYDEEATETAEAFLHFLCRRPPFPILEIPTDLASPVAIGYVLDPEETDELIHIVYHGTVTPLMKFHADSTRDGGTTEQMNRQMNAQSRP